MGTNDPRVSVRAATLAGGKKNHDRYAHGEGWAFVLDGASSFSTTQPDHDGSWYAERLKVALIHELTTSPQEPTQPLVGRAIQSAASAHDDPATCPTSTIALARWDTNEIVLYVLGDSSASLISSDDDLVLRDDRMSGVGHHLRDRYRKRLKSGYGFDAQHRAILRALQGEQAKVRNAPEGYWIAGAQPGAADQGLTTTKSRNSVLAVVLATDGASAGLRYGVIARWNGFLSSGLDDTLGKVHTAENRDPRATTWPRSKLHDDKTVVTIRFHSDSDHPPKPQHEPHYQPNTPCSSPVPHKSELRRGLQAQ